jgi:hypothetical protein
MEFSGDQLQQLPSLSWRAILEYSSLLRQCIHWQHDVGWGIWTHAKGDKLYRNGESLIRRRSSYSGPVTAEITCDCPFAPPRTTATEGATLSRAGCHRLLVKRRQEVALAPELAMNVILVVLVDLSMSRNAESIDCEHTTRRPCLSSLRPSAWRSWLRSFPATKRGVQRESVRTEVR